MTVSAMVRLVMTPTTSLALGRPRPRKTMAAPERRRFRRASVVLMRSVSRLRSSPFRGEGAKVRNWRFAPVAACLLIGRSPPVAGIDRSPNRTSRSADRDIGNLKQWAPELHRPTRREWESYSGGPARRTPASPISSMASRRCRSLEYSRQSFDELFIRIYQRIFQALHHPLHRQEPDGREVGKKRHQAGLDLRPTRTLVAFFGKPFGRAGKAQFVEGTDARELLLVPVDSAWSRNLTEQKGESKVVQA